MPDAADASFRLWPLLVLAGYLLLMTWQAASFAPSGRSDDLETLLLSQSFAWGYEAKNPPAFYWLAHVATAVFGPHLAVVHALRFTGVFLAYCGLYAIARRVQPDPRLAIAAGFAMLATLHFHWYLLFYLTNTALALALGPLAVLLVMRLRDAPSAALHAGLGAALGFGMLARYNFVVFAAALLLAALTDPRLRREFGRWRALLVPVAAGLLLLPHLLWIAAHFEPLTAQVADQLVGTPASYPARLGEGLWNLVESVGSVAVFPLGLLLVACFPGAIRRVEVAEPERAAGLALIGWTLVFAIGLHLAYVVSGTPYLRPHHFFLMSLLPIWLIGRVDEPRPRATVAFLAGLGVCLVAAAVAFPGANRSDAADCEACAEFQPIGAYATGLARAGFAGGTIVALSDRQHFPTAALRAAFPEARIIAPDYPLYAPPPNRVPGACLVVWSGAGDDPGAGPVPAVGLPLPADAHLGRIEGRVHHSGRPTVGMDFALVPGGLGDCR